MRSNDKIEERKKMLEEFFASEEYKPMRFRDIVSLLQVPKDSKHELKEILDSLISQGVIVLDDKGRYKIPGDNIKTGIFSATQRGFGFVILEGEAEDIFIPENATKGAVHGDKVRIMLSNERTGRRQEGIVLQILERGIKEIVGTFQASKNFGFVIPDNQKFGHDIFIPKEDTKGAVTGHKVVVSLTSYGDEKRSPEGKVVEIIGHVNDPGVDIMSVIKAYDLPVEFPKDVFRILDYVPDEVDPKEIGKRRDLRDIQTVTIDGEDAKDLMMPYL